MNRDPVYSGPAVPGAYVAGWNRFVNLTPAQVATFQSFPEDLNIYNKMRRWLAEISGITVSGIPLLTGDRDQSKLDQLNQAFTLGIVTTAQFFDASDNVHTVDGPTVKALYAGMIGFVESTFQVCAQHQISIQSRAVTTRAQIDAAYAAIAPNSPSASS